MRHTLTRNIKTPTTAIEMIDIANQLVMLMTCPLGGPDTERRIYKLEQALDGLDNNRYRVITNLIDRKLEAYNEPNEDGYSAADMDQAILRGC
jgi:hypothetical protein